MVPTVNARKSLAENTDNKDIKKELSFLEDISGIVKFYNNNIHEMTIDLSKVYDFNITKCRPNTAGDGILLTIRMR